MVSSILILKVSFNETHPKISFYFHQTFKKQNYLLTYIITQKYQRLLKNNQGLDSFEKLFRITIDLFTICQYLSRHNL